MIAGDQVLDVIGPGIESSDADFVASSHLFNQRSGEGACDLSGLAIGAVPAKRADEVLQRVIAHYLDNREDGETFHDYFKRIGRWATRGILEDLIEVPPYEEDSSFYSDWGDPREYTIGDEPGIANQAASASTARQSGAVGAPRAVVP